MTFRWRLLLGFVLLLAPLTGRAQTSEVSIEEIAVHGLVPFEVSFRLVNPSPLPVQGALGTVTLRDRSGQAIEQLSVASITVPPGGRETVIASSRWDFQHVGIYFVDVAVDLGGRGVLSSSFGFRILPIRLPLAPYDEPEGADLPTLYQEPISWGLARVFAPEAWFLSHGSAEVVVAVIDSGIDRTVEQLAEAMWRNPGEIPGNGVDDDRNGYIDDVYGWDFRDGDNDSLTGSVLHAHGTIVASILAARPGALPIVGIAPGIRLMDVRFLDSRNRFSATDWRTFAEAIDYAVDNGADLINMSIYANGRPPQDFERALERAVSRGVVIVGIAGNRGESTVMYPGRFEEVVAVSATSESDLLAEFSNRGADVALCAPGDSIAGLSLGGHATTERGTSFAAPHVTGVLALMLSLDPDLTPSRAVAILESTAVDLGPFGPDEMYGAGLVNALAALQAVAR